MAIPATSAKVITSSDPLPQTLPPTAHGDRSLGAIPHRPDAIVLAQVAPPPSPSAPTPPLWKPKSATKPSMAVSQPALQSQISRIMPGHIETAMHFALENLQPAVKSRIMAAYAGPGGQFDEAKFLKEFSRVAVGRLRAMDWGDILQRDSDPDAKTFKLSQVNPALEDVGKDIVVGAVFAEAPEEKVNDVLHNTAYFPKYGKTMGIGIMMASDCAPDHVTIQFGNKTFSTNSVTVVNENRNQLAQNGVQFWRLASRSPGRCPRIKDIGVNIGIESVFPYQDDKVRGHVVTYILFATPSTQLMAGRAMKNTLNGIEDLAEGK